MLGDKPTVVLSVSGRHCNKISGVSIHGKKGSASLHDALDDHITVRDNQGEEKIAIDTTFPLYLELKEFIEYLVKQLVNNPNEVEVTETQESGLLSYRIKVANEDMGIVIGKEGKNIKSIRNLAKSKAIKDNVRINIELLEASEV